MPLSRDEVAGTLVAGTDVPGYLPIAPSLPSTIVAKRHGRAGRCGRVPHPNSCRVPTPNFRFTPQTAFRTVSRLVLPQSSAFSAYDILARTCS